MQPSDFACTHLLPSFILREFTVIDAVEYFYIEIFNFVKRISAACVTAWSEKVALETLGETTVSLHTERNLNEMNAESKQLQDFFFFFFVHKGKLSETCASRPCVLISPRCDWLRQQDA